MEAISGPLTITIDGQKYSLRTQVIYETGLGVQGTLSTTSPIKYTVQYLPGPSLADPFPVWSNLGERDVNNSNNWIFTPAAGEGFVQELSANGPTSLTTSLDKAATNALSKSAGVTNEQANQILQVAPNRAPTVVAPDQPAPTTTPTPTTTTTTPGAPPPQDAKPEDIETIKNDLEKLATNTRKEYEQNLRYPENLQLNKQDCIKFTVFEYKPKGLSLSLDPDKRKLQGKDSKGSIILPIPGGISDSNAVDWQKDDLDLASAGIANLVTGFVSQGTAGANAAAGDIQRALSSAGKETLTKIVAVKTAQSVMGSNVLSRGYGGVLNPNSELLFNGPQLRSFNFTFRLSPRSSSEAKIVQKIIRTFKQSMSVQRTESSLLLNAPNTYGIEYITTNGSLHPYLTKFKECALTQFNVNYTPDGTYMTYAGDSSMTSYELQLTFQELEPVFNDDYGEDYLDIGY